MDFAVTDPFLRPPSGAVMEEISEFLPIKLSPGFIVVSFHLGCIGCNFCSVRYGNLRDKLFAARIQGTYPVTAESIYRLLQTMPSFAEAQVPLRIGNDTDYRFEAVQTQRLLDLVPANYPVLLLTRFPLQNSDRSLSTRENVMLKVTATPRSAYLTCPDNSIDVIESLDLVTCPVMLTIGPITGDNWEAAGSLIRRVAPRPSVSIYLKALNDEFDASLAAIPKVTWEQMSVLRAQVEAAGHRHLSQAMCPVNHNLGIPHKRVCDVPDSERVYCGACRSRDQCYSPESLDESRLGHLLGQLQLGMDAPPSRRGYKSYSIEVDRPTGFGDEAFLSEVLKIKIKLSGTRAGTDGFRYAASCQVLRRWQEAAFFPYEHLVAMSGSFVEATLAKAGWPT